MDLGPYEGIPGVTAPFVGRSGGYNISRGYFLDVDVDIPAIEREATPRTKRKTYGTPPQLPRSAPPGNSADVTSGSRDYHLSLGSGPPSAVFSHGVRMCYSKDTFFKSHTLDTIDEVPIPMGDIVKKPPAFHKYDHKLHYSLHQTNPIHRSHYQPRKHRSTTHKRGRLILAPHSNPDAAPPENFETFKGQMMDFTKDRVIPGMRAGAQASVRVTKERVIPGVKTGAKLTKRHTVNAAKWTGPKIKAGAIVTKDTSIKVWQAGSPKMKRGAKLFVQKLKRKKPEAVHEIPDFRDYDLEDIEEEEYNHLDETPRSIPDEHAGLLTIPEFKPRPNQISRDFKTPFFDKEVRRAELTYELGDVVKKNEVLVRSVPDEYSLYTLSEGDSPTYTALSTPEGYTPPCSIHNSSIHDVEKLKQEIQRLQKTLSEKEDLILASRRIASDKEKRLKADLTEVTDKYTEVCSQKSEVEEILRDLQENSVRKDDYNKLFTQYTKTESLVFELQSKLVNCAATVPLEEYRMLQRELEESTDEVTLYKDLAEAKEAELEAVLLSQADRMAAVRAEHAKDLMDAKKLSGKELVDRDNKLQLLKEQITSALDEKSVARQEQLKELSRELEHATQENRSLHKKVQEMNNNRQQSCEGCSKLKVQLKAVQEGKRIGELSVLKPIKEKSKAK